MTDPVTPATAAPLPAAVELFNLIKTAVSESATKVKDQVIQKLVEDEVSSRVQKLCQALSDRKKADVEFRKASKPDQTTFNADGSPASSSFSKPALESLQKAKKDLEKLDAAIEAALKGDFSKLE